MMLITSKSVASQRYAGDTLPVRVNHLSNATCLTQVFFNSCE